MAEHTRGRNLLLSLFVPVVGWSGEPVACRLVIED